MGKQHRTGFVALGSLVLLAGCESSGPDLAPRAAENVVPTAAGSPPVPPASSALVAIFAQPAPQEYASVGASTTSAGDGYAGIGEDAKLTNVSLMAYDQPSIRFVASGDYEIQLPGATWDRLVHYRGLANATADNNFLQPERAAQNHAAFIISRSRRDGYRYSEVAGWTNGDVTPAQAGFLAFGAPTRSAEMPAAGSATYRGSVLGMVDITYFDYLYGGFFFEGVTGTVTLTVDFAARTLKGKLELDVAHEYPAEMVIPSTVSLAGANGFSGIFESDQTGFNQFKVTLMGPNAEELIGSWVVPILIDGECHVLMGAWMGKHE